MCRLNILWMIVSPRSAHPLEALNALTGSGGLPRVAAKPQSSSTQNHVGSGTQRIAAAQRARWAKWKAAHRGK
jgi:hypothetical protein